MTKVAIFRFTLSDILFYLICFVFLMTVPAKKPPTMAGEPLNPSDFEKGSKLVMNPAMENDMTMNDGTMNDILEVNTPARAKTNVKRWPYAAMPYMLDSAFDGDDRAMIAKAIHFIHRSTCFRIISRTTEMNYVLVRKNINSTSCSSYVGMIGGKQRLNLASRCIQRVGSTTHEFMHAMGFHHEQSRPDRDRHVTVNYDNILSGRENNFNIHEGKYGNLEGPYDKLSITHYGRTAFSKNGKDTISPVKGDGSLGQRKDLTELDMEKVNEYYDCDSNELMDDDSMSFTRKQQDCKDFNKSDCGLWAHYGYCEKSPMLMTIFCKETCKKCGMGCVDMHRKCGDWAHKKYCRKYSDYMYHYCPRSCRRCSF